MAASLPVELTWKATAQDLRKDLDLSNEDVCSLMELTEQVKAHPSRFARSLAGRYLSLLFEKPSLRTRLTFELAIKQLGGDCVVSIGPVAEREPLRDVARNLDRWTHGIVARVFLQQTIDELARWSSVPVINALSDLYHPCQALADVFTIREQFGDTRGIKVAFVGDGNNVAHSLMLTATRLNMDVSLGCPRGYEPKPEVLSEAMGLAAVSGTRIEVLNDARKAVSGAHVVYTDVWASMGQEQEAEQRRMTFVPFQVNEELMAKARPDAIFMHCLPAKRGQETTGGVMESSRSVIFDQAENRLHAQKALLLMMLS